MSPSRSLFALWLVVLAACGTRMDRADIVAAAQRGQVGLSASGSSETAAGTVETGQPTATSGSSAASPAAAATANVTLSPSGRGATSPGSSSTAGGPATATAVTPVRIASLGTFSGPGALLRDPADAVAVWARWINEQGGVNGHRIQHVRADDGADPARHRALERELVEREHIDAFVYKSEVFAGLSAPDPYVIQQRVPVVGTYLGATYDYTSPFYFPQGSSAKELGLAYLGGWSEVAVPQGKTKLGIVVCAEAATCSDNGKTWSENAQRFGLQTVYQAKASITAPDYTAECLAARQAGVQTLAIGLDDNSITRLARACARQNYHPLLGIPHTNARPSVAAEPAAEGTVLGPPTFAFTATDNPARREFNTVMARLQHRSITSGDAVGWVAAKLFEVAIRSLPARFSREDLLRSLWSIRDNDLGGLTYPLSFFPDRGAQRRACWSLLVLRGQRYVAPRGGGLKCLR